MSQRTVPTPVAHTSGGIAERYSGGTVTVPVPGSNFRAWPKSATIGRSLSVKRTFEGLEIEWNYPTESTRIIPCITSIPIPHHLAQRQRGDGDTRCKGAAGEVTHR